MTLTSIQRKKLAISYHKNKKFLYYSKYIFSALSFLCSYYAADLYIQSPHAWYDITGKADIMLQCAAFFFLFFSIMIGTALTGFKCILYPQPNGCSILFLKLSLIFPYVLNISKIAKNLFQYPGLFFLPLLIMILVVLDKAISSRSK